MESHSFRQRRSWTFTDSTGVQIAGRLNGVMCVKRWATRPFRPSVRR